VLKQKNKKIIIVGYKSFIQQHLFNNLKNKFIVKKLRFYQINKKNVSDSDVIINCSNSKNFFYKKYNLKNDRNLKIANIVKNYNITFYLLSTRQVYAQKLHLTEKSKLKPLNLYAKNCLYSEKNCKKVLKSNLVILRLANVFGYEIGKKKKSSLVSLIYKSLKKGEINIDNNFYLFKDFLPITLLCLYIKKLIKLNVTGIINVGSGIPILVKDFVIKIVDIKRIKIKIKLSNKFSDKSYSYNINKLKKLTGIKINKKNLDVYFSQLKNKLM
jgi:nucleoside-diphosphate-sugar epimerase